MARSRSSGRPTASAPRSAPAQQRQAHTAAAYPPAHAPPAPATAAPQQPGMMAQMAATAGSVAAGSVIGHGISSMLFGGRSEAPAPVEQAAPVQQQQASQMGKACEVQAREVMRCLEIGDADTCRWYLDQLKACQSAAAPY
ncbi:hypothetical protein DACRYDRAFT_22019 [Dacryopinax primogenitus]|uniref:CHCH domain-containing protein n=1 Tax=Dacryopinax primogenitus (strain DJM 731) TaxID=1858805 RepID=M5G2A1_DACPD|nr:uncharacterized protein DACRYDRAFT_22019 [Dacryopinax primogenitus]EJU02345.1 hypothetical protein DACRYDRAFT_22019 [Dacryopinax primogenitus]